MKRLLEHSDLLIQKARQDLGLLEAIAGKAVAKEIVGFHFQQAAEKLMKAACTRQDKRYSKTHNIRFLMDLLSESGHPLPEQFHSLEVLTPFGVLGRYEEMPFDLPFSLQESVQILKDLEQWVQSVPLSETP